MEGSLKAGTNNSSESCHSSHFINFSHSIWMGAKKKTVSYMNNNVARPQKVASASRNVLPSWGDSIWFRVTSAALGPPFLFCCCCWFLAKMKKVRRFVHFFFCIMSWVHVPLLRNFPSSSLFICFFLLNHSFFFYTCLSCTQGSPGEHPNCPQVKAGLHPEHVTSLSLLLHRETHDHSD